MLKNYFSVAWRNLIRNKTFSIINIGGLAIGLAACWLIVLYVGNEMSYDKYHANGNRIYRLAQHATWDGGAFNLAVTSAPFGPTFKNSFPEIEEFVRLDGEGGGVITYGDKHIMAGDLLFADNSFFRIFSHRFIYGDAASLDKPNSIVITKKLAENLFGDASAAPGKTILFGSEGTLVTGVIEDVPTNSHFKFSGIRTMPVIGEDRNKWGNAELYTYVMLKKGAGIESLKAKMPGFFDKHLKEFTEGIKYNLEFQPLTSIHLHSALDYELSPNGSMKYIMVFSLVAALILIIASINYMNLSTARSSLRVKEIGVRKVNGAGRGQLVSMFLAESILLTFIATCIAMLLVYITLPWFQHFIGKDSGIWQPNIWQTAIICGAFAVFAGTLSGVYPALFISGFKLIPSLKGLTGKHTGNLRFRQSLVVFQFVITIAMIAGSFIIYQQLHFVSSRDLGFNKDQVLSFHITSNEVRNKIPLLKEELLRNPLIESAGAAGNPIGNNNIGGRDYKAQAENGSLPENANMANIFSIDEDFLPTLQVKMAKGRNFSREMQTDRSRMVLVNETFVNKEAWKTDPIGKKIQLGKDSAGNPILFEVAGVMKDFNIYSLQHKIEPLIVQLPSSNGDKDNMYVRISKRNIAAGLKHVEAVYHKFDSANPFEYSFLDENFAKQYKAEKMQGKLLIGFTVLAIVIACLGLFGLIAFAAEQRRKEIGIRKVLGSSVSGIVVLLSRDLAKLVLIAILIATPIAWTAMHQWLEGFAYRINIMWWVFAGAGLVALSVALATVVVQAIKAAVVNPVKSLRTE
jgi:putative ABC transport system permease protein